MGAWAKSMLVLVGIQVIAMSLLPQGAVADDVCSGVDCGKGSCEASANRTYGFVCNCNSGWLQFHVDDYFRFLPCVVPNCTIDYSCYKNETSLPWSAPNSAPPSNTSVFEPCFAAYCGTGSCVKTGTYTHRCDCVEGFSNLLNISSYPCFKDCALGADCAAKGITLSNSSSSSSAPSPSLSDSTSAAVAGSAPNVLLGMFILVITLASVRRA